MKCCSRSTLGVIIGGINVFAYVACTIVVIGLISSSYSSNNGPVSHYAVRENAGERENAAWGTFLLSTILSVCLVMVLISLLLIVGIVKRRHTLMWPWLALSGIAFICSCSRVLFSVIVGLSNGMAVQEVLMLFIAGLLGVGLQGIILWPIFTLCRDIMEKNNRKPGQVMDGVHYSYVAPDAPPQYNYHNTGLPQKS